MKMFANRNLCVFLLTGVLFLGLATAICAAPAFHLPGTALHKPPIIDQVGNAHLYNPRAPLTRGGKRLIGAAVPLSGTVKVLALKVQFPLTYDQNASGTGQFPYSTWGPASQQGYLQQRCNSLQTYYTEVSHGQVNLQVTLNPQVITLPNAMSTYAQGLSNEMTAASGGAADIMADTLTAITTNNLNITFAGYDIVMLIHAGCGQEVSSSFQQAVKRMTISGRTMYTESITPRRTGRSFTAMPWCRKRNVAMKPSCRPIQPFPVTWPMSRTPPRTPIRSARTGGIALACGVMKSGMRSDCRICMIPVTRRE